MTGRFRSRREASKYIKDHGLPAAESTLAKYATVGGGPEFHKFGHRVFYTEEALDAWITSKLSSPITSTSQLG